LDKIKSTLWKEKTPCKNQKLLLGLGFGREISVRQKLTNGVSSQ